MYRAWDQSKPPRGPFTLNRDSWQAQGLLCWYPMGPESRGVVYDRAGKNHFTTVTGVASTLTDAGSPALVFANGSSSILQSSVVPVYSPPITVACWARKDTASDTVGTGLSAFGDYTLGFGGGARRFQFDTHAGDVRWLSVGASAAAASKSGIVSGRWHHMMGVEVSTTSRYACLDGVAGAQNTASAVPGGTQNRFVVGAIFDDGLNQSYFNGQIGEFCVWNRSLFDLRSALADPGQRFALWYPLRSRKWFSAPAGGSTLDATLIEAAAAADIASASAILAATLIDAAASIDISSVTATRNASLADPAAGADISSVTATRNATLTDAAAGDDLRSALSTLVASLVEGTAGVDIASTSSAVTASLLEGVSAVDLASAVATLNAQLTDGVSAADLLTASMVASVAATEAAAGVDIANTGAIGTRSLVESAAAADVLSAAATLVVQVLEAGAGVDQLTAAQQLVVLLTESAAGTDLASGTKPAAYSVTAVELVAALDVLSGVLSTSLGLLAGRRRVVMPMLALTRRRVAMRAATAAGRSVTMYPV